MDKNYYNRFIIVKLSYIQRPVKWMELKKVFKENLILMCIAWEKRSIELQEQKQKQNFLFLRK